MDRKPLCVEEFGSILCVVTEAELIRVMGCRYGATSEAVEKMESPVGFDLWAGREEMPLLGLAFLHNNGACREG